MEMTRLWVLPTAAGNLRLVGIYPSQIVLEQPGGKETRHDATSGHDDPVLPLCDITHQPRPLLNVPGALTSESFVATQRNLKRGLLVETLG